MLSLLGGKSSIIIYVVLCCVCIYVYLFTRLCFWLWNIVWVQFMHDMIITVDCLIDWYRCFYLFGIDEGWRMD